MISNSEFEFIKKKIFKLFNFDTDVNFNLIESEDVCISFNGKTAEICGSVKTNTARALTLFVKNMRENKESFSVQEKKHFSSLGFGLDVSRNAVMRVESIKEYIDILASLGFDAFMLYMEDIFELEGYPYFGYRRGRYNLDELKEIDDYAYLLGVEVVPSVQTLGHLGQYLRWNEAKDIKENANVLLCGEEKTYVFIEKIIKTMRSVFRSSRININCDEAEGVGLGAYLKKNNWTSRVEILSKHLERVKGICEKYSFKPMVCGDFFLTNYGKSYYDFEAQIPDNVSDNFPDVEILYWDYYHTEYEDYTKLMELHKKFGRNVSFYGGIWTWCGILPNYDFTFRTMQPALDMALDEKVKNVWSVTYGDDGTETNMRFAIPALSLFSEKCFKGKKCSMKDIEEMSELITGVPLNEFMSLSNFHYPFIEGLEKCEYDWPNYMGKKIFYTDVLYNFTNTYNFDEILKEHIKGYEGIKNAGKGTKWEIHFDYARLVYEIAIEKIRLIKTIKEAYERGDKSTLERISAEDLPKLKESYRKIHMLAEKLWMSTNKVFGWEELDGRFGAVSARLDYAARTFKAYVNGEISEIEELEYDFIEDMHGSLPYGGVVNFRDLKSTGI